MQAVSQESVFSSVVKGFRELEAPDLESIRRTVLFRNGFFAGQRFACGRLLAVVPVGGDEVAFFGDDGELRKAVNLGENEGWRKAA